MADTYTTNLNLTKPEPGAAEDTWGISLNADLDTLDAIFSSTGTQVNLNANQINFADSKIANFGTNNDLRILHNGTNSVFSNYTGNLDFKNFADDSDIRFWSDDGSGGSAIYFKLDGSEGRSVASKDIRFEDGIKSTYGNSDDLQIYHDGSNSYIQDSGSGNLRILVGDMQIRNYGTNENIITSTANAEVALYYNASEKLATTSSGISVTGNITSTASTGNGTFNLVDTQNVLNAGNKIAFFAANRSNTDEEMAFIQPRLQSNSGGAGNVQEGYLDLGTTGKKRITINPNGDISFYEDTGTTQALFWDASQARLGIGETSLTHTLHVKGSANEMALFKRSVAGNSEVKIDTTTSGDAKLTFANNGTSAFTIGRDNSDSSFRIASGGTIGVNDRLVINSSGNATFSGTVTSDGLTVAGTSYIQSTTQPQLEIAYNSGNITGFYRSGGDFQIKNDNGAGTPETSIVLAEDGAVTLYHDASAKLATTSNGISVTGTVTSDALKIVDSTTSNISLMEDGSSGADIKYIGSNNNFVIATGTGGAGSQTQRLSIQRDTGDISFYDDTGTSQNMVWDASADSLNFVDNAKAQFGASNDLQIYHDGNNSRVEDTGTGGLRLIGGNFVSLQSTSGENMVVANENGAVSLYHNNSAKLATTSSGVTIEGTVTSDGLTVNSGNTSSNISIRNGSNSSFLNIYSDLNGVAVLDVDASNVGGAPRFQIDVSEVQALRITEGGDISFYDDTGSTQGLFWDASAESLGIGTTSPTAQIHLSKANGSLIKLGTSNNTSEIEARVVGGGQSLVLSSVNSADHLVIDGAGKVGIGTDTPSTLLHLSSTYPAIRLTDSDGTAPYAQIINSSGLLQLRADDNNSVANSAIQFFVDGGGEKARIDLSGNVIVGHSAADDTTASASLRYDGRIYSTVSGDQCLSLNRLSSDGEIITFKKDSTIVGNIKSRSGDLIIHTGITGLRFNDANDAIHPVIVSGSVSDGATDLGLSNARFKDLYLSGTANVGAINITGTGTSTFGGAITVQGNITTDGGDFKVGTNTVISSARAVDNVVSVTSSGNIQSTGGAFKWNVDGSGYHYLGTDIFDGLLMMSRADETIKFGSGETVSTTDAFQFWTSTTSTSNLGSKVFSITSGGTANFTGSVGIGTSSPDAKLEVSGGALKVTNAGNASIFINANAVGSDASIFFEEDDGVKAKIQHDASNDSMLFTDGAFADTMTLKGTNVGIGTSSPSEKLHVKDSSEFLVDLAGSDSAAIFKESGGNSWRIGNDSSTDAFVVSQSESSLGTDVRMFIANGGNVGIGTTAPSTPLHVVGTITADTHFTSSDTNTTLSTSGSGGTVRLRPNGISSTTGQVTVVSSGKVGIGTDSPSRTLHIKDAVAGIRLEDSDGTSYGEIIYNEGSNGLLIRSDENNADSGSNIIFEVDGGEKARINSSGSVGIGTTAPSEKLHVLGNTKITGNITVGASHTIGDVSAVDDNFLIASADNKDLTIKAGADSSTLRLKTTNTALTINPEGLVTIEKETTINDDLTINATTPSLNLIDTNNNPDYAVNNANGVFQIFDKTNDISRLSVTPAGNVGIGTTSPDADLHISSAGGTELHLQEETAGQAAQIKFTNTQNSFEVGSDANPQIFFINTNGNQGSGICMDTSHNVGIGTSSPAESLHTTGNIRFGDSAPAELYTNSSELRLGVDRNNDNGTSNITFYVNNSESARIDASGRLGIGTTSPETPLHVSTAKSSVTDSVLTLQDTTETFGKMIEFVGQGSTDCRGVIGFQEPQANAPELYIANGGTETAGNGVGLSFWSYITVNRIIPCDNLGNLRDNAIDLGSSSARFDDIYATNGTIQTSDRNQKQDIQALTDAEQRVATACKGLIRRFRWKDAVEEKDDNPDSNETARYHFGVIAQDLQDAFETEGLDAGDYGMFISQTWEDDDGVEQTRLGVRYNELLAFIITTL